MTGAPRSEPADTASAPALTADTGIQILCGRTFRQFFHNLPLINAQRVTGNAVRLMIFEVALVVFDKDFRLGLEVDDCHNVGQVDRELMIADDRAERCLVAIIAVADQFHVA